MSWNHLIVALAAAFIVTQVAIFATTIYLHRCLTHRALDVNPVLALVFKFIIWITTGMRRRQWVAVHRKHHANVETTQDPHSPVVVGFWRVQLRNVGLYRKVAGDEDNTRRYASELPPDLLDRLFFDHALLGLGVGIAIMELVMWQLGYGLITGLWAAVLHAGLYIMLSGAINAVGHTFGKRPEEGGRLATNNQWLAFITAGEGLHNHHHASPHSANFTLRKRGFDPAWWVIRVMAALRLVSVRHGGVVGIDIVTVDAA